MFADVANLVDLVRLFVNYYGVIIFIFYIEKTANLLIGDVRK